MPTTEPTTVPVLTCPACDAPAAQPLFIGRDVFHHLPGEFPLVRCQVCGAVYLQARPADLAAYYPTTDYSAYAERSSRVGLGREQGLNARQRLLQTLQPTGGDLLDVGCGSGDFLAHMAAQPGWQVCGVEPSAAAAEFARTQRGLTVYTGTIPHPELTQPQFDVITLFHVLEHVPDPYATLQALASLLRPGGQLVVSVPLEDSLEARWFGRYWAGYDVPRHLVTFQRASLHQLCQRAGLAAHEVPGVVKGLALLRLSLQARLGRLPKWLSTPLTLLLLGPLFVLVRLLSPRPDVGVFVVQPQ